MNSCPLAYSPSLEVMLALGGRVATSMMSIVEQ